MMKEKFQWLILVILTMPLEVFIFQMDLILFYEHIVYKVSFDDAKQLAAELNGDDYINSSDLIDLDAYLNFECKIDQTTGTVV